MTTTRPHPNDPTLVAVLDDEGRVTARTCRDDGLVHPVSALATHGRRTRHLCRSCHHARLAARDAARAGDEIALAARPSSTGGGVRC